MKAAALLPLLLGVATILPAAALAATLDLPPDPVAKQIRGMEPVALPPGGALDALASTSRSLDRASSSANVTTLDPRTTENAIALGRAGGVPFRVADLATSDASRGRTSTLAQRVGIPLGNVLSALTLGLGPTRGALQDIMTRDATFTTSDALSRRPSISDENAQGGVALLANGIRFDPHALVSFDDVARGGSATQALAQDHEDPRVVQSVSLPRATALAATPLFRANGTVSPMDLANASLRNSDNGSGFRDVRLPAGQVFAGLALHANGMGVSAEDLLDVDERASAQRIDETTMRFDRGTVLDALLLGARA